MMTSRIKLLYRCEVEATTHKVWLWHTRRFCVDCLTPVHPRLHVEKRPINLSKGAKVQFKINLLKHWAIRLLFEHEGCLPGRQFTDIMRKGPCYLWRHEHRFLPWKAEATVLEDHLEIEFSRFGWLNHYLHPLIEKKLDRLFRWRHHVTAFNLKLWHQYPFADRVHVIGLSQKTKWLTQRLKHQLEPIPSHEEDPFLLTKHHGLQATVFNAIGYTKSILGHAALCDLRKHHAAVLICFYDQKNPAWLDVLKAYADQLVLIEVRGFLNPRKWFLFPSQQEKWCSEEDLLSIIFQVLHDRKWYGSWHYWRSEPLAYSLGSLLKRWQQSPQKKKSNGFIKSRLLRALTWIKSTLDPTPSSKLFPIKTSPWKSFKVWKKVSYRV